MSHNINNDSITRRFGKFYLIIFPDISVSKCVCFIAFALLCCILSHLYKRLQCSTIYAAAILLALNLQQVSSSYMTVNIVLNGVINISACIQMYNITFWSALRLMKGWKYTIFFSRTRINTDHSPLHVETQYMSRIDQARLISIRNNII